MMFASDRSCGHGKNPIVSLGMFTHGNQSAIAPELIGGERLVYRRPATTVCGVQFTECGGADVGRGLTRALGGNQRSQLDIVDLTTQVADASGRLYSFHSERASKNTVIIVRFSADSQTLRSNCKQFSTRHSSVSLEHV
ncbi:hypothetical protein J1614_004412 [Plenodomus biglobosus]|nr:hypothetical protein J1614_004412 [Plenodomus biglobosus]